MCIKKSKLDLFLNQSLFKLQSNLINKEKALAQIIQEKDQTILEQQKIIRKLLQRQKSDIDAEVNRSYPWISSSPTANTNTPDSSTSTIHTLTDNGKLRVEGYVLEAAKWVGLILLVLETSNDLYFRT